MLLTRKRTTTRILSLILLALPLAAASLQVTKPEDVGLSADRLKRINELIDRRNNLVNWILNERDQDHEVYIEDKRYAGAPRSLCKVKDCNSQFASFQVLPASDDFRYAPVEKISMSMNQGLAMFIIYP